MLRHYHLWVSPLSTDEEKDENQGLSKLKEKTSFDY
ncbi:hypothetical protein AA0113_g10039 [Alternaria arborescens]|jgi:hypothetical protein|uniref:Uncharacterized protein n=1 Tax=Alternaria arborescens TaxID=156630 RepID=A0A4Q4QXE7_9PLEO|nr:hypothetical protein AA0111_g5008 [Alternaria arborescens]RYO31653.1 hypothetical protein AA0111_g5008 [Alternaria arborescens]RYO48433.1 hypothetical protein AA0113_g10039 [Alternaria arborescens]